MVDWLEDPLIFLKEGVLSYRQPKSLGADACREWKSFHFSTRLKLHGADYFLRQALGATSRPYDLGLPLLAFNFSEWYLDAFFFELVSAYETLLQEMNVIYGCGLKMNERYMGSKMKPKLPPNLATLMEEELKAEWFKKLRWHRNSVSHRRHTPMGFEKGGWGDKAWDYDEHEVSMWYFDEDAKEWREENIKVCLDFLKKMLEHIHAVWEKMAEEFD